MGGRKSAACSPVPSPWNMEEERSLPKERAAMTKGPQAFSLKYMSAFSGPFFFSPSFFNLTLFLSQLWPHLLMLNP